MNEAWQQGYDAYWADLELEDNPYYEVGYDVDSVNSWDQGWFAAHDEICFVLTSNEV